MKMKYLIIDLDQTLLHTDKSLSPYTREVFDRVHECRDFSVIVATGRSVMRAQDYMTMIHADGIISLNGAKTLYQNQMISEYPVDQDKSEALIRLLLTLPDTYVNVTYPTVILTNNQSLVTGDHVHEYCDYQKIDTHEIQKISLVSQHPEKVLDLDLDAYNCKRIDNAKDPTYFVILNKKVSKQTGLDDLCDHLSISYEDVIAFGDDYNDLDIMEKAHLAVAVENAVEKIQSIADEICPSNDEDGVAFWIEKHFFSR